MINSKNILLVLLCLSFFQYQIEAQNEANSYQIISQDSSHNQIVLCLNNGSTIRLNTRYENGSIESFNYLVEDDYCIVTIKPVSNWQEYIINAAYFYNNKWVQDYTDHSFFIPSTGISCTSINSLEILNATSFLVNSSSNGLLGNSTSESALELGKHGFFDCMQNFHISLSFGKDQEQSIRTDFLNR